MATQVRNRWDWTLSWQDPRKSTVFDVSPTSLGSNGRPIPHGPTNISAFGIRLEIAPATGGGCIYAGPFTNISVNLGPIAFEPVDGHNGLDYNPRCLSRDLSLVWSNQTKPTDVTKLISSYDDLGCFGALFEALGGVHAGEHFTMGGMGLDAFASTGDPAFYLHHAQVDRVWTIWQNLNAGNRTRQVYGISTVFDGEFHSICSTMKRSSVLTRRMLIVPPSPNVTLNTDIDFGVLTPQQPASSLVSSIDGPFCYMYI